MTTFTTQDRIDAQRTPLTDEQIIEIKNNLIENILDKWKTGEIKGEIMVAFARAIERAHGIGDTYHQIED